jgi:transglutaminase-like putative cysteine protease
LCALALLCGIACFSQIVIPEPVKITKEDLAQKAHPQDSTAVAAYLYRRGKTWYEVAGNQWVMVTEVYSRVKIYKKEGYDYANQEMVYYSGGRAAKGFFSDAATYNLSGGVIEKTELKKDSQFEQDLKEDYIQKRITLPNVKEGSIIEYKYTVQTPYFGELRDFKFQFDIPANDVRYDVQIPIYFYYNVYTIGKVTTEKTDDKELYNKRTDTKEKYHCYTAKNVKAIKDEAYVYNIDNYTAVIKHELAATAMPGQEVKKYATDWKTVAQQIYGHNKFGSELKYNSYFEDDIDPLLTKAANDTDKATLIFDYVKARMNYNQEKSYLCETGVKKAYAARVGNAAEINLMLTAMLRHAGLDANPVLVSTRDNGIAMYPTRFAYNYVIAAVKLKDKTVLLDATSKYSQLNILPIRSLNWMGRLIKKNGDTEEINLMPEIISKEIIAVVCTVNKDGTISGKVRDQYYDYSAYTHREKYAGTNPDSYIEKLEGDYKGITINDYKVTNEKDVTKPLVEDYSFTYTMASDIIGNKMYLNPMVFFTQASNPFKQETREYPIDFVYPTQDKYIISFKIPDGYTIESVPKAASIAMEQGAGSFKYATSITGNNIQLSVIFEINDANFAPEFYTTLKDFFQKMTEKHAEKIVLIKA